MNKAGWRIGLDSSYQQSLFEIQHALCFDKQRSIENYLLHQLICSTLGYSWYFTIQQGKSTQGCFATILEEEYHQAYQRSPSNLLNTKSCGAGKYGCER